MAPTVASITPADSPRQPACAAATASPFSSASSTGMQSATITVHTTPLSFVKAASASTGPALREASTTTTPCTCFSQRGSAGSKARNFAAPSRRTSPISRVLTSARTVAGACQSGWISSGATTQRRKELLHIGRQRRAPVHAFSAAGMGKFQRGRMQGLTREFHAGTRAALVERIADNRMPNMLEMHANLVRTAGFETAFQQGDPVKALDHLVVGARGPAAAGHRHARARTRVAADRRVDGAVRGRLAMHQREVGALHAAVGELRRELRLR